MSPITVIAITLIGMPLAIAAAIAWRRRLVMALPFLVIVNGVAVPLGRSSIRLDQAAACLLLVPLSASVLTRARTLRTDATVWWLAAILATNIGASVIHSPTPGYSLLQCANLASVWVVYLLLVNFLDTREESNAFVHRVLWAGIVASAVGIGAYLLSVAGLDVGGAEVSRGALEQFTKPYGAYGTMVEPNILGSFAAAHLVLAVALIVVAARLPDAALPSRTLRVLAALSMLALVLSFTRAAWFGSALGLAGVFLFGARVLEARIRLARILVPVGIGVTVVAALVLLPGDAGSFLRFKILNLVNFESPTALVRLLTYRIALQQTAVHPVIGWGTFTFAPLVAEGADFQQFENWRSLWIGNYLLLALHDTGVVGLGLWIGLLWNVLARGARATRTMRDSDPAFAGRTLALTAAVGSLLVPFLATTGFSLGYAWLLIGLLGAHCRLADAPAHGPLRGSASADHLHQLDA